jgi:hypothetical protein
MALSISGTPGQHPESTHTNADFVRTRSEKIVTNNYQIQLMKQKRKKRENLLVKNFHILALAD